jgi:hypothetical protein
MLHTIDSSVISRIKRNQHVKQALMAHPTLYNSEDINAHQPYEEI